MFSINTRQTRKPWIHFMLILACMVVLMAVLPVRAHAYAWAWDPIPPMPANDAQWSKVKVLWQDHAKGKNLPEVITLLTAIRDKNPEKVEAYVCLAKAYCLSAWYGNDRRNNFEKAEQCAAQACKMDPDNRYAINTLCEALFMNRDRSYIFAQYGEYLKSISPLKVENLEKLPEMKGYAEWNTFFALWQARLDMEKAKAAVALSEKMAQAHAGDVMAQIWAARTNYYVGGVCTTLNDHDQALPYYKKGIAYAEKAMQMQPQSQPANFWYVLNLSRSIQHTSLLHKARFLSDLLKPSWFCMKENSSYACFNMLDVCGTMITNGGWVTERGMAMAGITMTNVENGLELAEMLYPDFFYTSYCRADILAYKGKKKEALAILEKLLARNPDVNKQMPENHFDQREARKLYDALKQGKR